MVKGCKNGEGTCACVLGWMVVLVEDRKDSLYCSGGTESQGPPSCQSHQYPHQSTSQLPFCFLNNPIHSQWYDFEKHTHTRHTQQDRRERKKKKVKGELRDSLISRGLCVFECREIQGLSFHSRTKVVGWLWCPSTVCLITYRRTWDQVEIQIILLLLVSISLYKMD